MFVICVVTELVAVRGSVRPQIVIDGDLACAIGLPQSAGQSGPLEYRHLHSSRHLFTLDNLVHGVREEQSGWAASDDLITRGGMDIRELNALHLVCG